MRMNKKEKEILNKYFSIYDNQSDIELEAWTQGGVDMLIYLDRDDKKNATTQFEEYVKNFNMDDEIDVLRQDKSYKNNFTIKDSVEDFEKWIEFLNDILKELKYEKCS